MDITRLMVELSLPIIIIVIVLLELLLIPFLGRISRRRRVRRVTVRGVILLTLILMGSIYPEVINAPMEWHIANVFGNGIIFRIDLLSLLFMIFAGLIFFVVSLYTAVDIKDCGREKSFYSFFMITYVATLGTFMAGDLLSFFMFFEIMTFASYVLMVHQRGQSVIEAGSIYIYFGIIGGLSILAGILTLSAFTQSYEWLTLGEKFGELGAVRYLAAALFIVGFGVKAGLVPLHHWVPVVYPKSHLSVNALSSGILMKIGGYGILRLIVSVIESTIGKDVQIVDAILVTLENIGGVIIWLGILTMVIGVIAALEQEEMVRMLAYHSVSQMGYVIMGIGVAAYLGFDGAMGFAGSFYHMINHGIFKALLFMVAGAVYFKTKDKNMYRLGGLYKNMPLTATVAIIAAFGITGMPLFNGYASKTILHHAIVEAHTYGHSSFIWADYIFVLVSAGTAASFIKFIYQIFFGERAEEHKDLKENYNLGTVAMVILAVGVVTIGWFPNTLLDRFIIPAAKTLNYDAYFINNYLVDINVFQYADLNSMIIVYALGALIYALGMKFHLFHFHLPKQLNPESGYYQPAYDKFIAVTKKALNVMEQIIIKSDVFIYGIMLLVLLISLLNFL